jgi:hypothetical protein
MKAYICIGITMTTIYSGDHNRRFDLVKLIVAILAGRILWEIHGRATTDGGKITRHFAPGHAMLPAMAYGISRTWLLKTA